MYTGGEAWYQDWFNEDYLKLYKNRNTTEAKQQIVFLEEILALRGDERILDLGCGVGRHSVILADKGYDVVGVDRSPTFIQVAQRQYSSDRKLKFNIRDMRYLEGLGKFDLAISMFTSFGYFDSDADNRLVLRGIFYALNHKGKFFLDYLNPSHVIKTLVPYEEKIVDDEKVLITKRVSRDRVIKKIAFPKRTYIENVQLYKREQIETFLRQEGFALLETWGSYDGSALEPESERQLFLSQKMG